MTQAVLVALETFENIEGPRVSRSRRGPRCTVRALSAPAQEEDGSLAIGDGALQDIDKVRVSPSIGVGVPLYKLATRHSAYIVPLGASPNVDKPSLRQRNDQGVGFRRCDRTESELTPTTCASLALNCS